MVFNLYYRFNINCNAYMYSSFLVILISFSLYLLVQYRKPQDYIDYCLLQLQKNV